MPVVCGTDLSPGARPALEAAAAIAARMGDAELVAVHVLDPGTHAGSGSPEAQREELARRLAGEVESVRSAYGLGRVRELVAEGAPGETLARIADREGAGLLVVSSRGHGAAHIERVGGTSESAAIEAHVPVLVVREAAPFAEWARGRTLRVLLGVDWTPTTDGAIALVRTLRAAGPVDVVVAHVYFPGVSSRYGLEPLGPPNEADGTLEQLVARDLEARVGPLGGEGAVLFRPSLGFRRIGDHVVEIAAAEHADLVVVGSHGARRYRRLVSISSVVLHESGASVACVPRRPAPGSAAGLV